MMEKVCNGRELDSRLVFEVIGEPAVIIDGVPPLPPVSSAPVYSNAATVPESAVDLCFGEWFEGRKVRKLFGEEYYSGTVVKYDRGSNWYKVIYEDGDSEDLEWHELEDVLLPLDISVPLTTLALQRCKTNQSDPVSGVNLAVSRRGYRKRSSKREDYTIASSNIKKSELDREK